MRILIDADGCPIIQEAIAIASAKGIEVCLFCDDSHQFASQAHVSVFTCDQGKDHADFKLLQLIESGDIVITQDYGLAQLALIKTNHVLSQNGLRYTQENIDQLLFQRYDQAKLRKQKIKCGHQKKRTKQQDEAFLQTLTVMLQEVEDEQTR